jgi:hypothetical protein
MMLRVHVRVVTSPGGADDLAGALSDFSSAIEIDDTGAEAWKRR